MAAVKATARLEQLSCPGCANLIGQVVGKIPGVTAAEVRYTTNKLLVSFDDSLTTWEEIEKSVAKLGYQVISVKQEEE